MKHYAEFDSAGLPLRFLNDDIYLDIPAGLVELTDAQYQEFIDNQGSRIWKSGKIIEYIPPKQQQQAVVVSDTQFIQALAESEYSIISWDEAMNWGAQGVLPAILVTALDKITDTDTRNRAYMKARSAKSYIYSDKWVQSILPLLPEEVVAKMPGTDAQDKLQQLFNFAATL